MQCCPASRVTFVSPSTKIFHFERDFVVPHVMQAKQLKPYSHTLFLSIFDNVAYYNQRLVYHYSKVPGRVLSCRLKVLPTLASFFCSAQNLQFFAVHRALVYIISGKTRQDSLGYGIEKFRLYDQTRPKDRIHLDTVSSV